MRCCIEIYSFRSPIACIQCHQVRYLIYCVQWEHQELLAEDVLIKYFEQESEQEQEKEEWLDVSLELRRERKLDDNLLHDCVDIHAKSQ